MFGRKNKQGNSSVRQTRIPVQRSDNKEFFSYHATANRQRESTTVRQNASGATKDKRILSLQHIPMVFAAICLVLSMLYVMTLQPKVILRTENESPILRDEQEYREFAEKLLSDNVLNRSKVSFDSEKFEQALTNEFPELATVSVTTPLIGHKPIINLYAEQPVLLMASEKGVYILNKNGRAIVKASTQQPVEGLTIPLVRDEATIPIELGKGALTSKDVAFITTLVKQFENKNIKIDSLTLPPLASELRVRVVGEKYYIKFSLLTDPRIASGQYFAARKKFDTDNIRPAEYVDSRVEEKIFFK